MAPPAMAPVREELTLASSLASFGPDQLKHLLTARPDLAMPPPKDLVELLARADGWSSVNRCFELLNQACLDLIEALRLLPHPTTVQALREILGCPIDATLLDAALDHLAGLGLVFRQGRGLRLHRNLEHVAYPAGLGPPAAELLPKLQAWELTALAARLGVQPERTAAANIRVLTSALAREEVILQALAGAPAGTVELVSRLVVHPVETREYGTYNVKPETPLGWLAARGLVLAANWSTFMMPREVSLALRKGRLFPNFELQAPAITWLPGDEPSVDRAGVESAQRLVADLAAVLDAWQVAPPKLLKSGGLGVRELRKAAAAIGRTEVDAARLIDLAAAAGLAGWDESEETACPRPAYDQWLQLSVPDRWAAVAQAWLEAEIHVNVAGALNTATKPIPPLLDRWPEHRAMPRRRLVLGALLEGEPGQSASCDSLAARALWEAPVLWTGGPGTAKMMVSWVREEATVLGACADGALTSLGRALASGHLRAATDLLAAATPSVTSEFVVQADLTAVATGPLTTMVRHHLELMADVESSGSATVYRFSERSLGRAYDDGWTADAIGGFLAGHATKGVPQPLSYLVEDVGRRHGRLRVGSASSYVRSDDPSLLAEIRLGRRTAKLGLRPLAPTVLVSDASPETVAEALRAGGFLPAEEDRTGALVVRRPVVARATGGFGARQGVGAVLAPPFGAISGRSRGAVSGSTAGHGQLDDAALDALVRRLLTSHPPAPPPPPAPPASAVGQPAPPGGTKMPVRPAAEPVGFNSAATDDLSGAGGDGTPPLPRPTGITARPEEIREMLSLSAEYGWCLRVEFANKDGKRRQANVAAIKAEDDQHWAVVAAGERGTMRLAVGRITWARFLTEAEEARL